MNTLTEYYKENGIDINHANKLLISATDLLFDWMPGSPLRLMQMELICEIARNDELRLKLFLVMMK